MDEDVIVREIVKSLAFEIEATNEDNVLKWTTTNGTPLSVKVRVRNPDEPRLVKKGPIPVPRIGITAPDRLRLVSSDQTILSFNIYLDKEAEKQEEYKRSKLFQIFNIGGCLGTTNDDDGPYLPSSSNQKAIEHKSNSRSESAIFGISNTIPAQNETKKEPFGKCKPGGCLDPPFGEDRYPYSPSKTDRRTKLALEIRELEKKQTPGGRVDSILTEKLQLKTRSKENNQQKVYTERHEQEPKKEIDVIRGSSAETSRKSKEESLQCRSSVHIKIEDEVYSKKLTDIYARTSRENSLITYHIDTSSTESLYGPIPNKRASIKSYNESQRQTYEYPESYFVPPKDVLRYKEEERRYSKEPSNYQIGGSGLSKENDITDKINLIKAAQTEHKPISQNARGSKDINMKKLKLTLTELQPDNVDVARKLTANKISPTHLASDSKEPVSYILTDSKNIDDHRNVPDKTVEPDFNTTAKSNIVEQEVEHSKLQKPKKNRSGNVDIVNIEAKSDILINECSVAKSVDILLSTGEINKPIKSQATPLSDTNINVFADAVETNSQILDINPYTYSGIINDKIGMLNNKLPSNVTTDAYSDRKKVKDKPHEKPTLNDTIGMLNNKLPSSDTTDLYSDRKEVKDKFHENPTLNDKIGMLNSKLPSSDTIDLYSDTKNVKDKPHEKPTLNDKIGMLNNKLPSSETIDLYSDRKKVKDKSYEKPTLLESRSNVVKVAGSSYQDVSSKADQTLPMNDLHKNLKTDIYTTPSADIETKKTSSQSRVVVSPYMQKEFSQDAQHEFNDSNITLPRESKTIDPEALSIDKIKTGSFAEKIVLDHDQQKTSKQDSKSTRELEPNKVSNRQFIPGYKDVEDTVKNNDDKTTLYIRSQTESQITKDKPNVKAKEREYATLNPEVQRPETSVQNENIKNIGKNLSPSCKSSYENKEFDVSSTHSIDFMPKHPSSNASNDDVDTLSKKQTSAILHKTLFIPRTDLDIHDDDMNKTTQLKRQTFTIIRSDTSLPKQEEIEETPKDVTNIYLKATDNAKSVSPSQTLDKTDILDARSKKLDTKMQSNTSVEPTHKMTEKYVNNDTRSKRLDTKMQSNTSVEPPHRTTQENLNKSGSKITDLYKSISNDQTNNKPENLNRSNKDPEIFRDVSLSDKRPENNKDTSYGYASDRHGLLGSQNRDELDTKTTEGNKEYNNKLYDVSSGNVFEKPITQLYSKDTDYVSPSKQVSSKAALSTSNKDLEERTNGDSAITSTISQKPITQLYSKDTDLVSPSMQVSGKAALRTSNKDLEKKTNGDSAITNTISQEHRQESIEPPKLTGNGKYVLSSENRDNTEVGFSDTKSHRKADMYLRSNESDKFSLTSEDHDTDTTDNMSKAQEKILQKRTTSSHESVPENIENLHSKNTNDDILVPVLPVINETGLYVTQNGSDLGMSEKSVQENVKDLYAHVTDDGKLAQYIQNRDKSETLSITNKLIENRNYSSAADGTSKKPIPQNENEVISENIDYASPATQVIGNSEALSTGDKDLEARVNGDTAISTTISQEHIQKNLEPLKLTGNSKSALYPENSENTEVDFSDAKGYKKADLLLRNTERDTFSLTSDDKLVAVVPKSNRMEHLVKSYKEPEDKMKLEDAKYKDMDGAYSINSTLGENSSSELFPEVPNIAQVTEHDKYIAPNQPYTELIDTDSNQPQIKILKEKPKQSDASDYHGMKKASDFTETLAEGYSELSDNPKSVSEKSSPHSGYSGLLSEVLSNISEKAEEEERFTKPIMGRKATLEIDKDLLQINTKVNQDNELLGDKFSHRTEESIPTMPIIPGSNIEFASKLDENVYNVPKNTLENPSISTFEINRDANNKTVTGAFETVKHIINDSDQLKQQSNDYQIIINKPINIHRDVAFNKISEVENPTDNRSSKVPISVNYNIDLKRESFGTKPFIYNSGEEEKERTSPSHQVIRENGGLSQNGISYLDMSFYSYINNDNQRVVQTHSPPNEQQHRNDATVTVVKTLIRHGKEIRIPVDTENDLTLNIVDKDSTICNAGSNIASPTTYRHREHQIVDRTKKQDILTKNLALIYESGLIPLHNVIKDLTQQVNTLTSKQETLQDLKLSAKRSKSLRLIPVVKGCGCKRI